MQCFLSVQNHKRKSVCANVIHIHPTTWSKLERKNGEVPRKENFGQMECCPMPWFLKTAEDILGPILSNFFTKPGLRSQLKLAKSVS